MDAKELRTFAKSHKFVSFLTALGFVIIAVVVFEAGIYVGFRKASFAYGWEENYGRNFGDPRGQFGFPASGLPIPHGADGRIVSTGNAMFVVVNDDEVEKTVSYSSTTPVRIGREATSTLVLKNGAYVVVLGDPNASGTIAAQLIRILPPPEDMDGPGY